MDDDAATCDMLCDALEGPFHLTCQQDPLRVVSLVRDRDFHVVLLDLYMPGLTGIELLEQLREVDQDIAVVILTGHPSFETAQASIPHHIDGYVRKPVDMDGLKGHLYDIAEKKGISLEDPQRILDQIGKTVRTLRGEKGLSLRQLSRRSGLSPSLLSAVERAKASASVTSLHKVSTALGVHIRDLFDGI